MSATRSALPGETRTYADASRTSNAAGSSSKRSILEGGDRGHRHGGRFLKRQVGRLQRHDVHGTATYSAKPP
jgi:hypothetical protein